MKFEESIEMLKDIVEQMQNPDTSIEKAMTLYEQGMKLSKECMETLAEAQNQITLLKDGIEKQFEE